MVPRVLSYHNIYVSRDCAISKMKCWIPEPGTTISGFADRKKKRRTLDFCDIFFCLALGLFALKSYGTFVWP